METFRYVTNLVKMLLQFLICKIDTELFETAYIKYMNLAAMNI